jgi:hypothetical protein
MSLYEAYLGNVFPYRVRLQRLLLQELIDRFNDTDEFERTDGEKETHTNGSSFAVTTDAPSGFVNVYMSEASYRKWQVYDKELTEQKRRREEMEAAHKAHMDKIYEEWGHLLP